MADPQAAWYVLDRSVDNKIAHLGRRVPPRLVQPAAEEFDRIMREFAASILVVKPEEDTPVFRQLLALPTVMGGMGLQPVEPHLQITYVSAWAAVLHEIRSRIGV
jgi:hypothetical protein